MKFHMLSMNVLRAVLGSNDRHHVMDFCMDLRKWLGYMIIAT